MPLVPLRCRLSARLPALVVNASLWSPTDSDMWASMAFGGEADGARGARGVSTISAARPPVPGKSVGIGTNCNLLNCWSLINLRLYIHLLRPKTDLTVAN